MQSYPFKWLNNKIRESSARRQKAGGRRQKARKLVQ
jgi:hypothetical protein